MVFSSVYALGCLVFSHFKVPVILAECIPAFLLCSIFSFTFFAELLFINFSSTTTINSDNALVYAIYFSFRCIAALTTKTLSNSMPFTSSTYITDIKPLSIVSPIIFRMFSGKISISRYFIFCTVLGNKIAIRSVVIINPASSFSRSLREISRTFGPSTPVCSVLSPKLSLQKRVI